ncbi:hypothetical protein BDV09DRAFT_181358 [Aspergillus tetrazonus]
MVLHLYNKCNFSSQLIYFFPKIVTIWVPTLILFSWHAEHALEAFVRLMMDRRAILWSAECQGDLSSYGA